MYCGACYVRCFGVLMHCGACYVRCFSVLMHCGVLSVVFGCRTIPDYHQGPPLSIGSTIIDACVVAQRFRDRNPR